MTITTNNGTRFEVQRCYVNSMDSTLNIGLVNTAFIDAVQHFSNPSETNLITLTDEDDKKTSFNGYSVLGMVVAEENINGVYVSLHKR